MKKRSRYASFSVISFMPRNYRIGYKHSLETIEKIRKSNLGKKRSDETKKKLSLNHRSKHGFNPWNKGKPLSEEHRKKMSLVKKGSFTGEKNPRWKGGISKNKVYKSWLDNKRNRVLKRIKKGGFGHTFGEWELLKKQYGYVCPCCKRKEPDIKLTEDHIIPLSKGGTDLIENIQPLCRSCNCKKWTKTVKY